MKIRYTGAFIATQPRKSKAGFVLTAAGLQQIAGAVAQAQSSAPEKAVKLTDVIGAVPAGGLATGALAMHQLGNTVRAWAVRLRARNGNAPRPSRRRKAGGRTRAWNERARRRERSALQANDDSSHSSDAGLRVSLTDSQPGLRLRPVRPWARAQVGLHPW